MNSDDAHLLFLASRLATEAAAAILEIRTAGFRTLTKLDQSPVTEADHRAEALILAGLRAGASIPVIAEEEVAAGLVIEAGSEFWLVDPLDGTREFAAGNENFTVNIGLVRDGVAVLGAVALPAHGQLYLGRLGHGASRRDRDGETCDPGAPAVPRTASPCWPRGTMPTTRRCRLSGPAAHRQPRQHRLGGQVRARRRGRGRPLSAARPDHGVGHRRAAGGGRGAGGSVTLFDGTPLRYGKRAGRTRISSVAALPSRSCRRRLAPQMLGQDAVPQPVNDAPTR